MDKIYLNELMFYGYHGVFPEETKLGQRFILDVIVELDLKKAGESDDLSYGVSYADVYTVCKEIVEGPPFKLLEAVAEAVTSKILESFPLIQTCQVKVIKPDPPIPGHYRSVAVEIKRWQDG